MDAATPYMIVTLKDGTVRTRAFRQESVDYSVRAQKNLLRALARCSPIVGAGRGGDLAARPDDQGGGTQPRLPEHIQASSKARTNRSSTHGGLSVRLVLPI
jgi:hypothetical protein